MRYSPKPHIIWTGVQWMAYSPIVASSRADIGPASLPMFATGFGRKPDAAYLAWRHRRDELETRR